MEGEVRKHGLNSAHAGRRLCALIICSHHLHSSFALIIAPPHTANRTTTWTFASGISTFLFFIASALRVILDDSLFGATKQADSATDYFNSRFWDAGDPRNLAGACGWSPLTEGLRVTLAVTVCLLFVRCGDIFFLSNTDNHKMGTLALCAYYMFQEMLYNWMPLMCLVAMAWGIALSILSPRLTGSDVDVDSPLGDASATLARSAGIDFSPSGPFFAPFWGFLYMWFAPDKLTDLQESSVFTPFAVWSYLLINLVLFINLLIAMFNRTYEDVISRSKEEMRFHYAGLDRVLRLGLSKVTKRI